MWFNVLRGHPRSSATQPFDRAHTTSYSNLIESMRLSRTIFEILSLIFGKLKRVTWQWPGHFQGQFVVRRLGLAMINMYTKFEVSGLSHSRDILGGTKNLKWVTWRGHAHFRDGLTSVGWDLLCTTHILNLKCLWLLATNKWKATFWATLWGTQG